MVLGESPAVARRRVRLALREAREGKGLTQAEVAGALEWSLSKVNRIESGEVSVSTTDLLALLRHYGVDDDASVQRLLKDARTSRRQRWFTDPKYRRHLTPGTLQMLQFEGEASAIRVYNTTMIPGLFQTSAYTESVFEGMHVHDDLPDEYVQVRREVRKRRYGQVFGRADPPDYFLILDESVLFREVGGPQVMGDQLHHLLEATKPANIRVRVVPFAAAAPIALLGAFTVFDLGNEENAVLYKEGYLQDEVIQAPRRRVQRHREIFETLWTLSWDEDASAAVIQAQASAMLASHYRSAS